MSSGSRARIFGGWSFISQGGDGMGFSLLWGCFDGAAMVALWLASLGKSTRYRAVLYLCEVLLYPHHRVSVGGRGHVQRGRSTKEKKGTDSNRWIEVSSIRCSYALQSTRGCVVDLEKRIIPLRPPERRGRIAARFWPWSRQQKAIPPASCPPPRG